MPRTLSSYTVRRSGRISAERIDRAAELGRSWSRFMKGETVMPSSTSATSSTLPAPAVWAVLKPGRGAPTPGQASLHNKRSTLVTAVTLGTPWGLGAADDEAIFEGL